MNRIFETGRYIIDYLHFIHHNTQDLEMSEFRWFLVKNNPEYPDCHLPTSSFYFLILTSKSTVTWYLYNTTIQLSFLQLPKTLSANSTSASNIKATHLICLSLTPEGCPEINLLPNGHLTKVKHTLINQSLAKPAAF